MNQQFNSINEYQGWVCCALCGLVIIATICSTICIVYEMCLKAKVRLAEIQAAKKERE